MDGRRSNTHTGKALYPALSCTNYRLGLAHNPVTAGRVVVKYEGSHEYLNIESRAIGETGKLIILYFQVYRSACPDIET